MAQGGWPIPYVAQLPPQYQAPPPRGRVLQDWEARAPNELSVRCGQTVLLLESSGGCYPHAATPRALTSTRANCQIEGTGYTGYVPGTHVQSLEPLYAPYYGIAAQPSPDGSAVDTTQPPLYLYPSSGPAYGYGAGASAPATSTPVPFQEGHMPDEASKARSQSSSSSSAPHTATQSHTGRMPSGDRVEGDKEKRSAKTHPEKSLTPLQTGETKDGRRHSKKASNAKHRDAKKDSEGTRKDSKKNQVLTQAGDEKRRDSKRVCGLDDAWMKSAEFAAQNQVPAGDDKRRDSKKDSRGHDTHLRFKAQVAQQIDADKERRRGSDLSKPLGIDTLKKCYALWLGNEADFGKVKAPSRLISMGRSSEVTNWLTSHVNDLPVERVRLVTGRYRQGDGDDQAAEMAVAVVRNHAVFGKIPILIYAGVIEKVVHLWTASPPTYVSSSLGDVEAFCAFRDVESLRVPPPGAPPIIPSVPHKGGDKRSAQLAEQHKQQLLIAGGADRHHVPILAPGSNLDDAEAMWNDLDYQEEQAAVSEDERFEELRKSAFSKSVKRKTMKLNLAIEQARKLAGVAPPDRNVSMPEPAQRSHHKKKKSHTRYSYCFEEPRLPRDITDAVLGDMMKKFEKNRVLGYDSAMSLTLDANNLLKNTENTQRITIPSNGTLTVVGDIHGQLPDILHILRAQGLPNARNLYLFNGDFIDRGPNSAEVLFLIFAMKVMCPNAVFINRGNHETKAMNAKYTFEEEIMRKYDKKLYHQISKSFEYLPVCAVLDGRVIVLHGGLVSGDTLTLGKIDSIPRMKQPVLGKSRDPLDTIFAEILWSDPRPEKGVTPSRRGCGVYWGPDITEKFLVLLVRSHEVVNEGAIYNHDRCMTVFSASNYCGKQKNSGAYLVFKRDHVKPTICTFRAGVSPSEEEAKYKAKEDLIAQLQDKIYAARNRLRTHWGANKKISTHQLDNGLAKVLRLEMNWHNVRADICKVDSNGQINVEEFLNAFQLRLPLALDQLYKQSDTMRTIIEGLYAQRAEVKRIFRSLDTDGNGLIDEDEFSGGLEALSLIPEEDEPPQEARTLFKIFDSDNSGDIDYDEFAAFMGSIQLIRVHTP